MTNLQNFHILLEAPFIYVIYSLIRYVASRNFRIDIEINHMSSQVIILELNPSGLNLCNFINIFESLCIHMDEMLMFLSKFKFIIYIL